MEYSPIGKLPPELRNRIYEFAVTEADGIEITQWMLPPITRACKQTREESLQMAYKSNTFFATVDASLDAPPIANQLECSTTWAQHVQSALLQLVRAIRIDIDIGDLEPQDDCPWSTCFVCDGYVNHDDCALTKLAAALWKHGYYRRVQVRIVHECHRRHVGQLFEYHFAGLNLDERWAILDLPGPSVTQAEFDAFSNFVSFEHVFEYKRRQTRVP